MLGTATSVHQAQNAARRVRGGVPLHRSTPGGPLWGPALHLEHINTYKYDYKKPCKRRLRLKRVGWQSDRPAGCQLQLELKSQHTTVPLRAGDI
jgi:hypothetical protein